MHGTCLNSLPLSCKRNLEAHSRPEGQRLPVKRFSENSHLPRSFTASLNLPSSIAFWTSWVFTETMKGRKNRSRPRESWDLGWGHGTGPVFPSHPCTETLRPAGGVGPHRPARRGPRLSALAARYRKTSGTAGRGERVLKSQGVRPGRERPKVSGSPRPGSRESPFDSGDNRTAEGAPSRGLEEGHSGVRAPGDQHKEPPLSAPGPQTSHPSFWTSACSWAE